MISIQNKQIKNRKEQINKRNEQKEDYTHKEKNVELTIGSAVCLTLAATFLFAFWYQALKHLGDYPLAGFVMWLYISSFITILGACRVLGSRDMPQGIWYELQGKYPAAFGVCLGGAAMTYGLIVSLIHMKEYGMIANQAISGTAGAIFGVILTFVVGGLSPNVSLVMVLAAAVVLIGASVVLQYSGMIKSGDSPEQINQQNGITVESLKKQNKMLIFSNILSMGYSVAYMLGTRSELHPKGFPALLCVLLLSIGSLFAAFSYAAVSLTKHHQWKRAILPPNRLPIYMALGAGICHYGGNLMQIYALPLLSAPVSNLLLKTSSLWTYLWGIVYGEYKGAELKSKLFLGAGISAYAVGIMILTYALYC